MTHLRWRPLIWGSLSTLLIGLLLIGIWVSKLDQEIRNRLSGGWFVPPIEFYSAASEVRVGNWLPASLLKRKFEAAELRPLEKSGPPQAGEYTSLEPAECQSLLNLGDPAGLERCFWFWPLDGQAQLIALGTAGKVLGTFQGDPLIESPSVTLPPIMFAQFYGQAPVLRRVLDLGDVPLECLQAVTAIEDADFLKHRGISPSGIFRALARNVWKGRFAEGGSTITQQLIKVYFLTPEKTITRKLKDQAMALLLESRVNKDDILQAYLNVIYMGQNGPFEVRGFGSASRHYFGKEIERLNLSECALLAAIVNSPGRYSPFQQPERSKARRQLVLDKMVELNMISAEQASSAVQQPLPELPARLLREPAPYYVAALNKWIDDRGINRDEGLRVYTALDIDAQEAAQAAVSEGVDRLESQFAKLKAHKESGKALQGALISVDIRSGRVVAMVGGREYKKTQFNRILDSRRQVGSVMKPFVYGAALESVTEDGQPYSPLTTLDDSPFQYKYEGQSWSPKNYEGGFRGPVPMFYALKESLNVATARLATQVGLSTIVDFSRRAGIVAPLKALPSLSLGAFELSPFEVAQAYTTLARMGVHQPLEMVSRITDLGGEVLFESQPEPSSVVAPEVAAMLIGMLKQTIESGTARGARAQGFSLQAAGKTGTTSDNKDSWFSGFTPYIYTLVWIGYDDNTSHGLTGASGALPIWVRFMKEYATQFADEDFTWPEGVSHYQLEGETLKDLFPTDDDHVPVSVDLILSGSVMEHFNPPSKEF